MIPEKALDLARKFEGLRLKSYLCPAGIWTIGYGHTKGVQPNSAITEYAANIFLREDMQVSINAALKLSPILINFPNKLAAIADFIFNLGAGRYKISNLRKKVNEKNWKAAASELSKWVWGGGKKLPGLIARRAVEAELLRGERYENLLRW